MLIRKKLMKIPSTKSLLSHVMLQMQVTQYQQVRLLLHLRKLPEGITEYSLCAVRTSCYPPKLPTLFSRPTLQDTLENSFPLGTSSPSTDGEHFLSLSNFPSKLSGLKPTLKVQLTLMLSLCLRHSTSIEANGV